VRTRGEAHREAYEKILETAGDLILRSHGQLSLREIARDLGFGPASLYQYFESKEAILQAVADRAIQSFRDVMARRLGNLDDDPSLLPGIGLAYLEWARSHPGNFLLIYQHPNRRESRRSAGRASPLSIILEAVQRAHEAGVIPSVQLASIEQLAYALWATAHGLAMLELSNLLPANSKLNGVDRAVFDALVAGWR
jgi:AcrR family transcriptional regulator